MLRPNLGPQNEPGFIIPRVLLGNVVVMPQPLRHEVTAGTSAELRKQRIGHRSQVPLSHNYLATYVWLRQQLGAKTRSPLTSTTQARQFPSAR